MHPLIKHRLQGAGKKPALMENVGGGIPAAGDPTYANLKRIFTLSGNPIVSVLPTPAATLFDLYEIATIFDCLEGFYYFRVWFDYDLKQAPGGTMGVQMLPQIKFRTKGGNGVFHQVYTNLLATVNYNTETPIVDIHPFSFAHSWYATWNGGVNASFTVPQLYTRWHKAAGDNYRYTIAPQAGTTVHTAIPATTTLSNIPDIDGFGVGAVPNEPILTAITEFQLKLRVAVFALTVPSSLVNLRRIDLYYSHGPGYYS